MKNSLVQSKFILNSIFFALSVILINFDDLFAESQNSESPGSSQDANDQFIEIGSIASLTGFGSHSGTTELNGTILAIEDINREGGLLNKNLRLHAEDNNSETKLTISVFQKLRSINKIQYLIGPNWTEFSTVLAPLANSSETIMITPTGHSPELMVNRPYVFSMQFPASKAIEPLTKYIGSQNFDKIIIFISPSAYYEMLGSTLYEKLKPRIPIEKQIVPADSLDFRTELTKIRKEANAAIVVFMLENGPASTFVKQAKSLGIPAKNLILGPIVRYDEVFQNDHELAEGIVHMDYALTIPEDFQVKYKKRFNSEPAFGSVLAYDAVFTLKEGIDKCGLDPSILTGCLPKINFNGESGEVKFDENRNRILTSDVTKMYKIVDGKSIPLP